MSKLSYLEKLLDGAEVEWKTLGHIADIKRGTSITKKDVIDGRVPVIAGGRTPAYYHNASNRDGQTIVIAGSGAYAGFVSWWEQPIFVSDAFTVKPHDILLARYCYHFLLNMQQQLHGFKSGGGVPHVYPRDISPIQIPIPCPEKPEKSLAIQSEIVQILDSFTSLTAELKAELTMRKKQYNYYRDQLLNFGEDEVEWKTLGEVATFRRGTAITQKQTTPGNIPVVANGPTPTYFHSESNRQDETIVIARSGAYAGYVSFWNQPIFLTDAFSVHPILKIVKPKFLYHVLQNKQEHIHAMKKGAGVPHVRVKEFESYDVPIPHLAEQVRIVTILDKFDTLTNSISEGLPREIELRQKQYEYYRDTLFSFPKSEVAEA
ncbi:restriction endonuclease subunit S [Yersinia enterocolitica]|uniref:restriction endonuclease subunit S n=1 Tax=Yersinia enterocolitica TaxID=630 RepID=UPI0030C98ACC|nr:restriction endonuclease subunit S [Yersinia enterocolitica]HDL7388107.1 restriction endonuclease subunit S [Yersinia enterocolitica]